jgi:5-methylcytosine-specific restriction protein B
MELEPGDIVIANKGTSQVLAVGEVAEPGYMWRSERPEYRHTVRVEWDTRTLKKLQPQKRWALVTVAPVPSAVYKAIVSDEQDDTPIKPVVTPTDPLQRAIRNWRSSAKVKSSCTVLPVPERRTMRAASPSPGCLGAWAGRKRSNQR